MDKTPKEIIQSLVNIGYTQQEIAQKSDLTQATISRLLSGSHQTARLATYKKLVQLEIDNGDKSDNAAIVVGSTNAARGQNTENGGDAGNAPA